jgi:hypothetical protein
MRLSGIDLNLLTVFDATYRDGGITPAREPASLAIGDKFRERVDASLELSRARGRHDG